MDTYINADYFETATTVFGFVMTLAVLVVGFNVGRKWLARAGLDENDLLAEDAAAMQAIEDPAGFGSDSIQLDDLPDFPEMKDAAGVYADDWAFENPWVIVDEDVYVRREDLDQYYDAKRARSDNGEYWI